MKILDKTIEAGLLLIVIFTPLAFGTVHVWAYTLFELAVLFLVSIWIIKMIYHGEISIPSTSLNLSILAFIFLIFFQLIPIPEGIIKLVSPSTNQIYVDTINSLNFKTHFDSSMMTISINPDATKIEFFKMLAYIGVFYLIIGNMNTSRQINKLLMVIIITGFIISLFGLIQHFSWNGKVYWYKELTHGGIPFGPFINRNNFAGYINLIIPIALSMFVVEKDKDKKILFGFMSIVMVVALFLSLSRGGIISFVGAMVFMGCLLLFKRSKNQKGALILGSLLVCTLIYLIYIGINPVLDRLFTLSESETYLKQGRLIVWVATLEIAKDFKMLGSGLDTFETIFPHYQPLEVSKLYWLDAHNDYIQFTAETGMVGVLIASTFFIKLFKRVFSSLNDVQSMTCNYLLIGLLSSIVAFMISIIFTFNTHIPANALLFAIVIAVAIKVSMLSNRKDSTRV